MKKGPRQCSRAQAGRAKTSTRDAEEEEDAERDPRTRAGRSGPGSGLVAVMARRRTGCAGQPITITLFAPAGAEDSRFDQLGSGNPHTASGVIEACGTRGLNTRSQREVNSRTPKDSGGSSTRPVYIDTESPPGRSGGQNMVCFAVSRLSGTPVVIIDDIWSFTRFRSLSYNDDGRNRAPLPLVILAVVAQQSFGEPQKLDMRHSAPARESLPAADGVVRSQPVFRLSGLGKTSDTERGRSEEGTPGQT